jgi:hypothetical protein
MNNLAMQEAASPLFLELKARLLAWNRTTPWLCGEDGKPMAWRLTP